MLLSLLGIPTTRVQALGLFALRRSNPDYTGASHSEIGNVFARAAQVKRWHWEYQRRFDFASVSKCLRTQQRNNDFPTLLSFGAIHKNGDWQCLHVVVAIRVADQVIEVLDPLGPAPVGRNGNVRFQRANWSKSIGVVGNSYSLDPACVTAVLRWER